jgi:hypothetical protein
MFSVVEDFCQHSGNHSFQFRTGLFAKVIDCVDPSALFIKPELLSIRRRRYWYAK